MSRFDDMTSVERFDWITGKAREWGWCPPETVAALRTEHDKRVTDLLDANNRFEQRARDAERVTDLLEKNMSVMGKMLADIGRERDALRQAGRVA